MKFPHPFRPVLSHLIAIVVVLAVATGAAVLLSPAAAPLREKSASRLPTVFSTPAPAPVPSFTDPYFAQMADRLGLVGEGRELFQRAEPQFAETIGLGPGLVGEVRGGQIRITTRYRGRTDSQATKYVAHEYLHIVWYRNLSSRSFSSNNGDNDTKKAEIVAAIDAFYNQHKAYFDAQLAVYNTYFNDPSRGLTPGSDRFYSELHSLLGTEVLDSILPPVLQAHYAGWIPNRAALPSEFRG